MSIKWAQNFESFKIEGSKSILCLPVPRASMARSKRIYIWFWEMFWLFHLSRDVINILKTKNTWNELPGVKTGNFYPMSILTSCSNACFFAFSSCPAVTLTFFPLIESRADLHCLYLWRVIFSQVSWGKQLDIVFCVGINDKMQTLWHIVSESHLTTSLLSCINSNLKANLMGEQRVGLWWNRLSEVADKT